MAMQLQLEPFRPSTVANLETSSQARTTRMELTHSMGAGGFLSAATEREFMSKVESVVQLSFGELVKSRERIDTSLEDFLVESSKANQAFSDYALQIAQDLKEGRCIDPVRIKNAKFFKSLATQISGRYEETAQQLMQLEDFNREGKFGDYAGAIDLVYKARMEQLKYVQSKMQLLHSQESHELQLLISMHNQKLKEEAQNVDQMLKMANFQAQEKEREFRRKLDLRTQQMQEEEDLLELAKASGAVEEDFRRMEAQCSKEISEIKEKMKKYLKA